MNTVKVVLGFVELALALKFLSKADLVSKTFLLKRELFIAIWIIITIGLVLYLFKLILFPHDDKNEKTTTTRKILGVLGIGFVIYLVQGLFPSERPKLQMLSGILPPINVSYFHDEKDGILGMHPEHDYFKAIELAKKDMRKWFINLPDENLAYFPEGTDHFDDYVEAVEWAQDFAALNRRMMMAHVLDALRSQIAKPFDAECEAVNCHHNYVARENHFGENVLVTRKGAVRAAKGTMGIIPGSMGAKSFIVRGLGNPESFDSCSHGAGRVMSRTAAKKLVTLDEHIADTAGVECRKDEGVIDETPKAYKPIEAVMAAQADLVEIVHTLKQVVCVKG